MRYALSLLLIAALASGGCKLKKDEDGGVPDAGRDAALGDADGPTPVDTGSDVGDGPGKEAFSIPDLGDLVPHKEYVYLDKPWVKLDSTVTTPDGPTVKSDISTAPTSATIGTSGGTLISSDGKAVLIVWAGALSASATLTVKPSLNTVGNVGLAYDFGPATTSFSKKVKVIITYDPKLLKGAIPANLAMGVISSGVWTSVSGSTVNASANQVSAEISTLGVYGVLCQGCKLDAGVPDGAVNDQALGDAGDASLKDAAAPLPDVYSVCKHPSVSQSCGSGWCQIPAGCFVMGSPKGEKCRNPDESLHPVKLTKKFEIMDTSVTQLQFLARMSYNPSFHKTCGSDCPVETVSWHEAAAYCNSLSQQKSLTQCYSCAGSKQYVSCSSKYKGSNIYQCPGYRLPTEAEWEYAYRGCTVSPLYNGQIYSCSGLDANAGFIGWYGLNSGSKLNKVKLKKANAWGLYDMAGNVYDWTNDWYLKDLGTATVSDPAGPSTGLTRVFRGGSWKCYARTLRGARRSSYVATQRYNYIGFRCVRSN